MYKLHILNTIQQLGSIDFEIEVVDTEGLNPSFRMWKNFPDKTSDDVIQADFELTLKEAWKANNVKQVDIDTLEIKQDVVVIDKLPAENIVADDADKIETK